MTLLETLRKNLTTEQFTQLQDAVGDDFDWDLVPRSRLNKVIKQRNELREQLAGKSQTQGSTVDSNEDDDEDKVSGAKKTSEGVNIEELQKQWKAQQDKAVQDVKIQYAALDKLRAANVIDAELVWNGGLIDRSKLTLGDDGSLTGLDDIISDLQKNKAHLFKAKSDVPEGTGKDGGDPFAGVTTKEAFLKLDIEKQLAFKQANPTLFKQFLQS